MIKLFFKSLLLLCTTFVCSAQPLSTQQLHEALKINATESKDVFEKHVKTLSSNHDVDAKLTFLKGLGFYRNQELAKALDLFSKAIDLDQTFALPLLARATIFAANNDIEKAIDDLSTVINIDSGNMQAIDLRIKYFLKSGKYQKALIDADLKLKLQPNNVQNYVLCSKICKELNSFSKSEQYFVKALAIPSINLVAVNIAFAQHLMTIEKYKDAIFRFKTAEKINQNALQAVDYNNLSVAFMKTNNLDEAHYYANKALLAEPKNIDFKTNLASILLAKKDWKSASAQANEILFLNPENIDAQNILVFIEKNSGTKAVNNTYSLLTK